MKRPMFFIVLIAATLWGAAANAQNFTPAYQTLKEYNRIQPLQNPNFQALDKVLSGHILDDKNKVVGEVRDIIVNENGNISSLQVEFDRLHLGAPVYMNYREMRMKTAPKGYTVAFTGEEIESLYPQLLSNIETAAGNEDVFSVRKLIGAEVKDSGGRNIGSVQDVLFNASGSRAEALYINMTHGTLSGQTVAIPYSAGHFQDNQNGKTLTISAEQADAMIDYSAKK